MPLLEFVLEELALAYALSRVATPEGERRVLAQRLVPLATSCFSQTS